MSWIKSSLTLLFSSLFVHFDRAATPAWKESNMSQYFKYIPCKNHMLCKKKMTIFKRCRTMRFNTAGIQKCSCSGSSEVTCHETDLVTLRRCEVCSAQSNLKRCSVLSRNSVHRVSKYLLEVFFLFRSLVVWNIPPALCEKKVFSHCDVQLNLSDFVRSNLLERWIPWLP